MRRGAMNCVMGGQAGSESKGKMSAYLASKFNITNFCGDLSPNAGHTVIINGRKLVTHHIPAGVAGSNDIANTRVILGPASVINPNLLIREIDEIGKWGFNLQNLFIDERAAIITQHHVRKEEREMTVIGSTAQGVGEARAERVMRRGLMAGSIRELHDYTTKETSRLVLNALRIGTTFICEMGQGFDLCQLHGIDPIYCTSRIVNPMQALADMGVPPRYLGDVYAVIRPYPIRVNNRTGSSGPYPSEEITWEKVGRRCGAPYDITEITTTTKLKRRVFEFSMDQIKRMIEICNPDYLCLQFANYIDWRCYGTTGANDLPPKVWKFVNQLEYEIGIPVAYIGTGPSHGQMVDRKRD